MSKFLRSRVALPLVMPITAFAFGLSVQAANAQNAMYNPIRIPASNEITDSLTDNDIPTGQGGFARDYLVPLEAGDQVAIDLTSDEFDTILTLLAPDGSTSGENDDGPDGTTNSLLFARISTAGNYILRVQPYGGQGTGSFKLKVTRLRPI
jgi:Bacterial pre-peptidase C-terminal domain